MLPNVGSGARKLAGALGGGVATPPPVVIFTPVTAQDCADLVALAASRTHPLPGRSPEQGWSWEIEELYPAVERVLTAVAEINAGHYWLPLARIRFAVLRYGPGQRMGEHTDEYHPDGERRLLSTSVQLGGTYSGGDLRLGSELETVAAREVGTGVVFLPSVPHEVTPVASGVRWSLVGWAYG